MRKTLLAPVAVLALAGAACSSNGGSSTPSGGAAACSADTATATTSESMKGIAFTKTCFQVSAGTTISLSNEDSVTHSFTLDDPSANVSVDVNGGATGEATAPSAGTYSFHCRFHAQMTGTLIVA